MRKCVVPSVMIVFSKHASFVIACIFECRNFRRIDSEPLIADLDHSLLVLPKLKYCRLQIAISDTVVILRLRDTRLDQGRQTISRLGRSKTEWHNAR